MEKTSKAVLVYAGKSKNRRMSIVLWNDHDEPYFIVKTKRLVSFKERAITETNNAYSIETFIVLQDLMEHFIGRHDVKKLINPYLGFDKWNVSVYEPQNIEEKT